MHSNAIRAVVGRSVHLKVVLWSAKNISIPEHKVCCMRRRQLEWHVAHELRTYTPVTLEYVNKDWSHARQLGVWQRKKLTWTLNKRSSTYTHRVPQDKDLFLWLCDYHSWHCKVNVSHIGLSSVCKLPLLALPRCLVLVCVGGGEGAHFCPIRSILPPCLLLRRSLALSWQVSQGPSLRSTCGVGWCFSHLHCTRRWLQWTVHKQKRQRQHLEQVHMFLCIPYLHTLASYYMCVVVSCERSSWNLYCYFCHLLQYLLGVPPSVSLAETQ